MQSKFPGITGVILAGGQARRMGGEDKGLIPVAGRPMIAHVIDALRGQLDRIIINANRNLDMYRSYALPVIADQSTDFNGPLAGMATCMKAAETEYIITVPCDSPLLPADYVQRMFDTLNEARAEICVAENEGRLQPVFALLRCTLLDSLTAYLADGGRKIDRWFEMHAMVCADFSDRAEMFINVNTPADISTVEAAQFR